MSQSIIGPIEIQTMNSPKRLLILGASPFQVPLILRAKETGAFVITTDFLPGNPGHKLSDEAHHVSTTDSTGILELAREKRVDGVLTFASDPALPAVAFASNKLGLKGPSIQATDTLCCKDNFRTMLRELGLPVPRFSVIQEGQRLPDSWVIGRPLLVKPVDSSGSRGITFLRSSRVEITQAIARATEHSRVRRCIVEEYIEGDQVHGDAYLRGGKIKHHYLGDHSFFTGTGNLIPVSTTWPSRYSGHAVMQEVIRQVETACRGAGYHEGPLNIEARITPEGQVYLIEVSPRNGGNLVPIIQSALTGFDFLGNLLADTLRHPPPPILNAGETRAQAGAYYVLHAPRPGILKRINLSEAAQDCLHEMIAFKEPGDAVPAYTGSNTSLGVLLFRFPSEIFARTFMAAIDEHVVIEIAGDEPAQGRS